MIVKHTLFWLTRISFSLLLVSSAYGASKRELVVVLQGGDVQGNMARLLGTLSEQGLLQMETAKARAGETVSDVYQRKLDWPKDLWSAELQHVVRRISGEEDVEKTLEVGQIVHYPDVDTDRYKVTKIFDMYQTGSKAELERVMQQWGDRVSVSPSREGQYVTAELKHLQVKLMMSSQEALREAIEVIRAWRSAELVILTRKPKDAGPSLSPQHQFSVRFEGGNLAEDVSQVLEILVNLKIIPMAETRFQRGDTPDKIYRLHLSLPVFLSPLASKLNGKDYAKGYKVGDVIKYPDQPF